MKHFLTATIVATSCLIPFFSAWSETGNMVVTSTGIENNKQIAEKFAFCAPDGKGKTKDGGNISPQLAWFGSPKETKSFAVVVVDPDVPVKFDDANKEGKTIEEDFPRQNFYHWMVVDIPANVTEIAQGQGKFFSSGTALINDFASFIKDKPAQTFLGYDGPCPPFNDARLHHYHFIVYALDVATLKAKENSSSKDVIKYIEAHIIAKGELVGTYSNFVK
jgi:Raf kinase inhibitor-like YbhB/YbcL family protein